MTETIEILKQIQLANNLLNSLYEEETKIDLKISVFYQKQKLTIDDEIEILNLKRRLDYIKADMIYNINYLKILNKQKELCLEKEYENKEILLNKLH